MRAKKRPELIYQLIIILTLLAASWAQAAEKPCRERYGKGPIRPREFEARYYQGKAPEFSSARGSWRLKGLASNHHSELNLGGFFDSTGYEINDVVPEIVIVHRTELWEPEYASLLSCTSNEYFVRRRNWGRSGEESSVRPQAVRMIEAEEGVADSDYLAFDVPLYDCDGPDLFLGCADAKPLRSPRFHLQCRVHSTALVCLGRNIQTESDAPVRFSDFLWFERR